MTETEGTATFRGFARLLGERSPSYVHELKQAGRLVLTDDGKRVRVAESIELIRATSDPSKAGVAARHAAARGESAGDTRGGEAGDDEPAPSNDSHASRRSRALADKAEWDAKAAQRDYLVSVGRLLDAGQVAAAADAAVTGLRTRLEAMPYDLAPRLAAIVDEGRIQALLVEEIEHALTELARQFGALAREAGP